MEPVKILIVDDESLARQNIHVYLGDDPRFTLLDDCQDGFSAVKAINQQRPDIVFLDIQMPKLSGFEVIELLDYSPVIIFSTAYDEFALKAFEVNAVDYLLKPYSRQRFQTALEKAVEKVTGKTSSAAELAALTMTGGQDGEKLERIVIRNGVKIDFILLKDVVYLESADDYVMVHTLQNRYLKQKTMSYFETRLPGNEFVRVHRSYILNINYIARIEPYGKETWVARLKGTLETVSISRSGYGKLREVMKL